MSASIDKKSVDNTRFGRYFISAKARRTLINGQSFVLTAKGGFYVFL